MPLLNLQSTLWIFDMCFTNKVYNRIINWTYDHCICSCRPRLIQRCNLHVCFCVSFSSRSNPHCRFPAIKTQRNLILQRLRNFKKCCQNCSLSLASLIAISLLFHSSLFCLTLFYFHYHIFIFQFSRLQPSSSRKARWPLPYQVLSKRITDLVVWLQ